MTPEQEIQELQANYESALEAYDRQRVRAERAEQEVKGLGRLIDEQMAEVLHLRAALTIAKEALTEARDDSIRRLGYCAGAIEHALVRINQMDEKA